MMMTVISTNISYNNNTNTNNDDNDNNDNLHILCSRGQETATWDMEVFC